jgi:hypothetical protein
MVETVESDDDSVSATSAADNKEESAEPFELLLSCDNCHRCRDKLMIEMELHHPVYCILVTNVHLKSGAFHRKFSTICSSQYRDGFVPLCVECARYLTGNRQRQFASVFPAFMWVMLTNEALLQKHGHRLWSLVPARWRHWWLPSVKAVQELSGVTIDDPKPVVKVVTVE